MNTSTLSGSVCGLACFNLVAVSAALLMATGRSQGAVPEMISYQGQVTVSSAPFAGIGRFKFALVDRAGTNTFWSHDGSSLAGAAPTTEINLPVVEGFYSVLLGDRSLPGMTQAISASVFEENTGVYLRVWFNDGTNGSQQLSPDTRIAAVGYALVAAKVADGGLTDEAFKPNLTLGGTNTAGTLTLKSGGAQTRAVLDAGLQSGSASLKLFDVTGTFDTARLVGAESGGAGAQLLLKNGAGNTTLELDAQDGASTNAGGVMRFKKNDGRNVLMLEADLGNGNSGLLLYDAAGSQETVRLTGAEAGEQGAFFSLKNSAGHPTVKLDAQRDTQLGGSGGKLELADDNGRTTVTLLGKEPEDNPIIEFGASLQLANSEAKVTARLSGGAGQDQGSLTLLGRELTERVELDAGGNSDGGALRLAARSGNNAKVVLEGDGGESQGKLTLRAGDDITRLTLDGDGVNNGGEVKVFDSDGTMTVDIRGAASLTSGALIELSRADGTPTITLSAESNGEGKITTQVLQITGGSDLSEQFDVNAPAAGLIAPGAIVCIDPERPGELRVSDRAYDPAVAGIISGAGGVKPGMLMGQAGTPANGQHPVALTGRVYCRADASFGTIKPGDLITTSPTPGHGMKADSAKAGGAILGKAMTSLAEGRGLVLVLVSLQ